MKKPTNSKFVLKLKTKIQNGNSLNRMLQGNFTTITGLMADTEYVFQVCGLFKDQEGPYGPVSDSIKTKKSLATTLLEFCGEPKNSNTVPLIYQLPFEENINARNESARTRQLFLGIIYNFLYNVYLLKS